MMLRGKQVPVLVAYRKESGYTLSLVFMPELRTTHLQFEKAVHKLRQAVRHRLERISTRRDTLDGLLWTAFSGEFRMDFEHLAFESGPLRIDGLLAVIHFEIGGQRYACLPMLDALIVAIDGRDPIARSERIGARAQSHLREQRKKQGDAFNSEHYLAQRSDSCMPFDFSVHVNGPKFSFEGGEEWFATLRGTQKFEGRVELPRVAQELNERYPDDLNQAILRDAIVEELGELLYQQAPGCIALVGPAGSGKTAVLHETLRRHIRDSNEQNAARLQKMWHIDPLRIISGMSIVGQWQRRMEAIIDFAANRLRRGFHIKKPDHLLCDNMVALFRVGKSSQNSLTLADALRPFLERRELTMIAEATPEEWQKVQEYDRRFAELFRVVRLPELPRSDALAVVAWQRARLERQYRCRIASSGLHELLKLVQRFDTGQTMPGPAIRALTLLTKQHEEGEAGVEQVRKQFEGSHHFREKLFAEDHAFAPREIEQFFAERLIGQQQARACLEDVVCLIKSGLARSGKPLASLLFIGPTGVGKTEAAKVLAEMLFGADPGGLIRFDMNEFVDGSAVTRLIGDRDRPDGQLTTAVRQRKACVLLLDEIEKADPSVHDLLLQVLGEGRLTDALGRTTDFSQCVIVLTSNLGAAEAARVTGFVAASDAAPSYREAVTRFFRPEFLNRIDRQIAFTHLAQSELAQVARLHIGRLLARDGFVRRMTFLNVADATIDALVASGYDPQYGARALKRHIERLLTGPTAEKLATEAGDRPMILDVHGEGGRIVSRATVLDYARPQASALPLLQGDALSAYRELQQRVQELQDDLWQTVDEGDHPHELELRALQDRLYVLKERIDRSCWHLEERRNKPAKGAARRQFHADWYMPKRNVLDDLIAQNDIAVYLDEVPQLSERMVEEEPYYLDTVLQMHFWEIQYRALEERGLDHVCFEIVSHRAADSASFAKLWSGYAALFNYLDAGAAAHPIRRTGRHAEYRALSAPALETLLAVECGVHLWFSGQEQAMPFSVHLTRLEDGSASDLLEQAAALSGNYPEGPGDIVRLVHETATPRQMTVTDLRSNLVRRSAEPFNANDWKLLLYHGTL
jgi:ATP-dependent Clp protease ATP-binding subunit ClpC